MTLPKTNLEKEYKEMTKEEAAALVASCNIKITMNLEEPQSTYELFEKPNHKDVKKES